MTAVQCLVCDDTGWVCENHLNQPWFSEEYFGAP